jgi:hypothetical protein
MAAEAGRGTARVQAPPSPKPAAAAAAAPHLAWLAHKSARGGLRLCHLFDDAG